MNFSCSSAPNAGVPLVERDRKHRPTKPHAGKGPLAQSGPVLLAASRSLVEIAADDQGSHLSVGDASREHPEPAVRVHEADAFPTQRLCGTLDPGGDQGRALDLVVLDVDHAQVGVQGRLPAGGRYDELGRGADGQVWAVAAPDQLAVGLGRKKWRKASGARERPSRNATSCRPGGQSGVSVGWPRIPACGRI